MQIEAGQVAVVTGAAHGIGRAVAAALHARNVQVVLADIEADTLKEAVAEFGDGAVAVPTNVADSAQVEQLAEATMDRFGRVDLLFNNAGISSGGPSWQVELAAWQRVWSVNVDGVVHGVRAFVPHMVTAGRGHVVNTASIAGLTAGAFNAPYAASKHAVVALSESLHNELAVLAPNVGVTVVCPGPVDTRLLRGVGDIASILDSDPQQLRERPETAWLAELTPEQRDEMEPVFAAIAEMTADPMSTARAAEIVLAAVEADRLYTTTHPDYAPHIRTRVETIVADLLADR
ncbi:SDR family NAD(P)-dependent oxidoreductase [Nocardia mexicana]|uniref:NADP-dependent 3-hydroxy acid dehydrogenase YdfG n=1 Tax=Nocardia mexicana TaxID=279262 RepID=A0A370HF87_9NOCA|nr:SDR family NAD(P)-dependent oxidoreductase [Nocardia mexicana]RDI55370.1 NADP-dependent 3-hydroxy acid dehydrogenase YdfG [Nocardia mexicana]